MAAIKSDTGPLGTVREWRRKRARDFHRNRK